MNARFGSDLSVEKSSYCQANQAFFQEFALIIAKHARNTDQSQSAFQRPGQ